MVAGDTESWAPGGFEDQGFSVGSNGFQGFSADVAGRFGRESYSTYLDLEVDATDRWLVSGALFDADKRPGEIMRASMGSSFWRIELAESRHNEPEGAEDNQ